LILIAALLAGGVLAARAVKLVPHRLLVTREAVEQKLPSLDQETFVEAHRVMRDLTDQRLRIALRTCVDHAAESLWVVRADGEHLWDPDLKDMDDKILGILRQALTLAGHVGRLALPDDDKPQPGLVETRGQIMRRLREIEKDLDRLRVHVRQMH